MICIEIKENEINIKGHAGYADTGKDIVCAAVSILIITFINTYGSDIVKDEPGEMIIRWNDETDTTFLITGLRLIADTYPKNVKIQGYSISYL